MPYAHRRLETEVPFIHSQRMGLFEDWERVRQLAPLAESGELHTLGPDDAAVVLRVAKQVGLSRNESASKLRADPIALLLEAQRRIRVGSQRLGVAIITSHDLAKSGDPEGAQRILREILETDPVSLYRQQAKNYLRFLGLQSETTDRSK